MKKIIKPLAALVLCILTSVACKQKATRTYSDYVYEDVALDMTSEDLMSTAVFSADAAKTGNIIASHSGIAAYSSAMQLNIPTEYIVAMLSEQTSLVDKVLILGLEVAEDNIGYVLPDLITLRNKYSETYGEGHPAILPETDFKNLEPGKDYTIHVWETDTLKVWLLLAKSNTGNIQWKVFFQKEEKK